MTVGNKIKATAAATGTKLSDIAEGLGITPGTFTTRLKTGKFSFKELEMIAKLTGTVFEAAFTLNDGTKI